MICKSVSIICTKGNPWSTNTHANGFKPISQTPSFERMRWICPAIMRAKMTRYPRRVAVSERYKGECLREGEVVPADHTAQTRSTRK